MEHGCSVLRTQRWGQVVPELRAYEHPVNAIYRPEYIQSLSQCCVTGDRRYVMERYDTHVWVREMG